MGQAAIDQYVPSAKPGGHHGDPADAIREATGTNGPGSSAAQARAKKKATTAPLPPRVGRPLPPRPDPAPASPPGVLIRYIRSGAEIPSSPRVRAIVRMVSRQS